MKPVASSPAWVDIAAAAPELAGDAAPEQRERDAGMILEAAMIGRVDIEAEAGAASCTGSATSINRSRCAAASLVNAMAAKRSNAGGGAPTAFISCARVGASLPPSSFTAGGVLAVERGDDRRRIGDTGFAQVAHRQRRRIEIDHQLRDTELQQRFGRQQHGLGIGGGAGDADQLDAGLADLALGAHLLALHAQHLPRIRKAQRPGAHP